jgi:3-isopropylmalate/(R)-2-methylmalate dehydratase small subunit
MAGDMERSMAQTITGKALKYGDNINTDIISPPQYMELSIEDAAAYAMGAVDPDFAEKTKTCNVFVAEKNLGAGSSRDTAPLTLKHLGVKAVVAVFFARIFYRNCINIGLPAIECADAGRIGEGDDLEIDPSGGTIANITKGETYACSRIPAHIMELVSAGGLKGYLKSRQGGAE